MRIKELLINKMQDYAYRERNALNLLSARPWSPSDILTSASSRIGCNSIAEEDEEEEKEKTREENKEEHEEVAGRRRNGSTSSSSLQPASLEDAVFESNDENENT